MKKLILIVGLFVAGSSDSLFCMKRIPNFVKNFKNIKNKLNIKTYSKKIDITEIHEKRLNKIILQSNIENNESFDPILQDGQKYYSAIYKIYDMLSSLSKIDNGLKIHPVAMSKLIPNPCKYQTDQGLIFFNELELRESKICTLLYLATPFGCVDLALLDGYDKIILSRIMFALSSRVCFKFFSEMSLEIVKIDDVFAPGASLRHEKYYLEKEIATELFRECAIKTLYTQAKEEWKNAQSYYSSETVEYKIAEAKWRLVKLEYEEELY